MTFAHQVLRTFTQKDLRSAIRTGQYQSHTAGLASGYLQTNLVILSEVHALDFFRYCQRNPKPCPLVGVSDTGDPMLWTLGEDIDVRTDVPGYYVYEHGKRVDECTDIKRYWRDDFVAFLLGCSFTFENAVRDAGISLWHVENDTTVPMFRTNLATTPSGVFSGNMVVSMRMLDADKVEQAREISARYPLAHGAPVHIGDPRQIGIADINQPDFGDRVPVDDRQVPAFWACGVTPQVALEQAEIPLCITHKPGCMLITDVAEDAQIPIINSRLN